MRIAYFRTDDFHGDMIGGSFSHMAGFINALKSLGHEVLVISNNRFDFRPSVQIPFSDRYSLPEIRSIAYNRKLVHEAIPVLRKFNPDILYHRHSDFNFATGVLSRRTGIPLVLECNGSEVWIKSNWSTVYNRELLRRAENLQFDRAKLITVVSWSMANQLLYLGIPEKKVLVNPNGVDTDIFHPSIDGGRVRELYELTGPVVGFVGTFGVWHGAEVLARTTALTQNVHYLIIGDGERRAAFSGTPAILTGKIAHELIPEYLAVCDILVSPTVQNPDNSTFFGSPTKLFEYMAMGKAIVASSIGQIREVIRDGVDGILVPPNDERSLAGAVERLARDPQLRAALGRSARERVMAYTWKANAQRVIEAVR